MQILISLDDYCKAYNLHIGVYSPLSYFVGSSDLISIANELKLKDGSFYPLPIYLPLRDKNLSDKVLGESVDLIYENTLVGFIEVSEVYEPDKDDLCINLFGSYTSETSIKPTKVFS
jgi:sulfate adenylyltransferase